MTGTINGPFVDGWVRWLVDYPQRSATILSTAVVVCVDPLRGSGQIVRDFTRERALLSPSEKTVLRTFQQYLVTPGNMLCFFGPNLEKHKAAFRGLTEKDLLVKEHFKGSYSMTRAGFEAMKACDNNEQAKVSS